MILRIFSCLMIACLGAGCMTAQVSSEVPRQPAANRSSALQRCDILDRLEIHAHRGSNDRPENMISAFERGVDRGADFIELDLQISKDNQVIVAHDAFLRSDCLDSRGKSLSSQVFFRNLSVTEIKTFDCGSASKIGRLSPGEKVPTLAEVFRALKDRVTLQGKPVGLNIELKYNPSQPQFYPDRQTYAALVLKVVRESGWDPSRLLLQSFDVGILETLRAQGAEYRLSPLLSEVKDGIAKAKGLRTDTVTPHYGQVTPEMIENFHRAGLRVIPWTVNEVDDAKRMIDLGVDGVITDRLDLFLISKYFCAKK
ncbi:MAG: hypothetical protein KF789_05670 [Bdellovibrionaceae bacterium]|nr:hypothetical protein [Pseudobdellovibrionaceae bacterium]